MATITLNPNAHPETASVDGYATFTQGNSPSSTWDAAHDAAEATSADDLGADIYIEISTWATGDRYNQISRGYLVWDLSSVPVGTTLTAAKVRLYLNFKLLDWVSATFSLHLSDVDLISDTAIGVGDYDGWKAPIISAASLNPAQMNASAWHEWELNVSGLNRIETGIGGGVFKVCLFEYTHDYLDSEPTHEGTRTLRLRFSAADNADTNKPELVLTVTNTTDVRTDGPTDVEETTATLNGTLIADGGEACDCGFEWGTTTAYGNTTSTDSKTTGQSFSQGITGLSDGETYHYRAIATNVFGPVYGADVAFTAGGDTWPVNPLLRSSGLVRSFWGGVGGQSVYQTVVTLGGISTTFVSPIGSREPPSAVTPTPDTKAVYDRWLNYYITYNLAGLLKTFGHIPTYEEWLKWIKQGQAPYFPKYF